ncbi:MAG: acyl-CoA dehydrogenase [Gammaproteobacteria bacterium]
MIWFFAYLGLILLLTYHRASLSVAIIAYVVVFSWFSYFSSISSYLIVSLWIINIIVFLLFAPPIRRQLMSRYFLSIYQKVKPKLSSTEEQALAAGTIAWAGELFSGAPNWHSLLKKEPATLTEEEKTFLDGPVAQLCERLNDWDITQNRLDLPEEVWQFIKEQGFFGLIIPKRYGGKGFSATAHSAVITKIASCGNTAATTVAVPNSLGPAELLLHYGTEEQRNYYLPRLASGEEIPCFALTAPEAGSDAGAITDNGVICEGEFEGKKTIGIRLNFNKRYITLAPVATVIGLAFKLYDPEKLIGNKTELGITCALIPRHTSGISIGRRHFPLNSAFQNGPIQGKDVFIPIDWIIGGVKMAGKGWQMLIECLSVGRGITLPSMAVGGAKAAVLTSGVYCRIRKQFGLSIGKFEGVQEALARIIGNTYIMDALRLFSVATIDEGEKPAVLTAIAKYHATSRGRIIINDAMDIHGGKGICLGPNNYLGRNYEATPISITVEGANILTRSMIIFGQGAIRCHPYILPELHAAVNDDKRQSLKAFDRAVWGHIGFIISNLVRCLLLGLTGSAIVLTPKGKAVRKYWQYLTRYSSILAFLSDMAMMVMGANLKRKEAISARLGDMLSMLCLGSVVLKRFYENNCSEDELPLIHWACQDILYTAQQQVDGILRNFPSRVLSAIMRFIIFPLGRRMTPPSDKLQKVLADLAQSPNAVRSRLAEGVFYGQASDRGNIIGKMEEILAQVIACEPIDKVIAKAKHDHVIKGHDFDELVTDALAKQVIDEQQAKEIRSAHEARLSIIAVDDFDPKDLTGSRLES